MDTLTKPCSPTIVITANGEVQTHGEATVYVKELGIFLTLKVLEDTTAVLSLGKLCDANGYSNEWINGQKPHLIKNGIRTQCNTENFVLIVVPGLSTRSSSSSHPSTSMTLSRQESHHSTYTSSSSSSPTTTASSDRDIREREDQSGIDSSPVPVSSSNVEEMIERRNPLFADSGWAPLSSEIPEWLQEFRENLVDERVPEQRDSHASSSHEVSLEPTSKKSEDSGKHSVYTHFPKDRNCETCQRTKITRAPCRRLIGGTVPRTENFGDLITADHKVLSEGCESRNNHRYAIVVQDLATQWIQSYPCKTKTFQETQRSLQKFSEPDRKPKVIYTDNSLEFGKACEDFSWNHFTSTPHRSETNEIAERAVRRVKEGTSAVLLQSGLNENWWADSMECKTYLRNVTDLLSDGKTPYERRFGQPFAIIPFGVSPYFCERPVKNPSIWKESLTWIVPWIRSVRGRNLEGWHVGCRHWGVGNDGRIRNLLEETQCTGSDISQRKWKIHFSSRRWTNRIFWRRSGTENTHLDTGTQRFSWRIRRISSTTSRLTSGCRWSDAWFLVHVRKLHIPPSRWTQSQT